MSEFDDQLLSLGGRIRILRDLRGWSQRALAKKAGTSYANIAQLETGHNKNPTLALLIPLANAFEISLDRLVGREPTPKMKGKW